MQVRISENGGVVSLLTDKVNGTRFTMEVAQQMFAYRDAGQTILVPSRYVLIQLNNFARSCYKKFFELGT